MRTAIYKNRCPAKCQFVCAMPTAQVKVLCLYLLLKIITAHNDPSSKEHLAKYLATILADSRPASTKASNTSINVLNTGPSEQMNDGHRIEYAANQMKPVLVRSMVRTLDSLKLASPPTRERAPSESSQSMTQSHSQSRRGNSTTEAALEASSAELSSIQTDREGYSHYDKDYRSLSYEQSLGNAKVYLPSEIVGSYASPVVQAPADVPLGPAPIASFAASPLPTAAPIVLSGGPLPPIQRIIEPVPVPVEVIREQPVERVVHRAVPIPEPVPVPIIHVREVPVFHPVPVYHPIAIDRPVYIERRVPVPVPEPVLPFAPLPPITQAIRVESTSFPLPVLKRRIWSPFGVAPHRRFGRLLRGASSCLPHGFSGGPRTVTY